MQPNNTSTNPCEETVQELRQRRRHINTRKDRCMHHTSVAMTRAEWEARGNYSWSANINRPPRRV